MEQKTWWYTANNEQKGPVSFDELNLLVNQNFINKDSYVWKQGLPNWIKFSEINAQPEGYVSPSMPPANPAVQPQSSQSYSQPNSNIPPQSNQSYSQPNLKMPPQSNPNDSQPYASHQQPNASQSIPNSGSHTPSVSSRLSLVTDFYYRSEFDRIINSNEAYKGKFNWWAFFFSWIWCLTKGLWQYALAVIVLSFALRYIEVPYLSGVFALAVAILFGLKGTWFYYNQKIKNKQLF